MVRHPARAVKTEISTMPVFCSVLCVVVLPEDFVSALPYEEIFGLFINQCCLFLFR